MSKAPCVECEEDNKEEHGIFQFGIILDPNGPTVASKFCTYSRQRSIQSNSSSITFNTKPKAIISI